MTWAQFRRVPMAWKAAMLLTLALALVATTLVGAAPRADGYTPASLPAAAGNSPAATVTVKHTPTSPQPKQGEQLTYTMQFALTGMVNPGVTTTTTVHVYADPNAPFDAAPTLSDFTMGGAALTGTLSNCSTLACTVTFTNLGDGTLTFTKKATVKTALPDGTLIIASADVDITSAALPTIENVSENFTGGCSGTYTFVQKVGPGGAWLVDIKFADVAGTGKVVLTQDGSTQIKAWNDPTQEGDTIKIVTAGGTDVTGTILAKSTYLSNDPSSPYYLGLASTQEQTRLASADWLDSLNWRYDPSTWTGDTWLDAGTVITVQREVTYANCLPGGATADGTTARPFAISTQVARPAATVSASAVDTFAMPGTKAPESCVNNLYVAGNAGTAPTTMSKWTPNGSTTSLGSVAERTDAIAASSTYASYIFAIPEGSNGGLKVFDTATGAWKTGTGAVSPPSGLTATIYALGFAPDGTLYAVSTAGVVWYLNPADVTAMVGGTAVQWKLGATLKGDLYEAAASSWRLSSTLYGRDLAFTADGTMYLLTSYNRSAYIITIPGSSLKTAGTYTSPRTSNFSIGSVANASNDLRSLAFVGDVLYAQIGTTLSTVAWRTPSTGSSPPTMTVANATATGYSLTNAADFASCSFPGTTPTPTGPAFQVQKSVLNTDGSLAAPGTTGATRTVNPDGTITVDYYVTVTNIGTTAGSFPAITDTVTVPSGFTVTKISLDGVAQAGTSTVTIPSANLDPLGPAGGSPISRTYKVTVNAKLTSTLAGVDWAKAGTCNTATSGTASAGGFFNVVTMTGDKDGTDNNDACAPVSIAQLKLVKQIVDRTGALVTSTDAQYFTLTASGPSSLNGVSATSGAVGPNGYVIPGTYLLGEQGNDGGTTSGRYKQYAPWACTNLVNSTSVPLAADGSLTVAAGTNIQCVVKNTLEPKVHIVKTATTATADNSHIGTAITPAADGTFTASYTITVTNTSGFTTTTGKIMDGFIVPTGLLWDGTKTATVSFNAGATGATASGLVTSVTQAQLAAWATLATSVNNLPHSGSASFTITIPLKLDLTIPSGQTQTVYQGSAATLAACQNLSSATGGPYTGMGGGIPNMTGMVNEDLTYSTIAVEDNVACVPVAAKVAWAVSKAAAATTDATGAVTGWAPAGTTGGTVQVANDGTVTANYKVVVTNTGDLAAMHPAITDTMTTPTGFTITGVTVKQGATAVYTGTSGTFTIPASTTSVPKGGSVEYLIQVKALAANLSTVDWTKAATCTTTGAGSSTGGFFNAVTLTGDTDGTDNNDACVPVTPPPSVTIMKVNPIGGPLTGAGFQLYGPNSKTTPLGAAVTVGSDGRYTWRNLTPGTYWIKETVAPTGYGLDPFTYQFTVAADGTVTIQDTWGNLKMSTQAGVTMTFTNYLPGALPQAGGFGPFPYAVGGLLLMIGAFVTSRRRQPVAAHAAPRGRHRR